jgi:transposase
VQYSEGGIIVPRDRNGCAVWDDRPIQPGEKPVCIRRLCGNPGKPLAKGGEVDSGSGMIGSGFLDSASRRDLIELARDGSAAHRLARRANALVLLDDGMSCAVIAQVLFLDDDTIRTWYQLYREEGIEGLANFGHEGGTCRLTVEQQDRLKAWIAQTLPRTTRQVGAWIGSECGIDYQSRSGLIALLHRLGMEHRTPKAISRKLDPAKQAAFIGAYNTLLNQLSGDEAVLFADAVHPTHAVRPVGCWAPKAVPLAVEQNSGRDRLNIHGAIDLESGQTIIKDVLTVDALSTILLLTAIEAVYPNLRLIHVFLDNARYHHAKLVRVWLARPECRIKLHFVPAYCPHLNPIERLWGLMHRHTTHNKCYATFTDFSSAMLTFLRDDVPRNWRAWCDQVTDNFRIINPTEFRIIP